MSVLCFLVLILWSWSSLLWYQGFKSLSPLASHALLPVYALNRAHNRDTFFSPLMIPSPSDPHYLHYCVEWKEKWEKLNSLKEWRQNWRRDEWSKKGKRRNKTERKGETNSKRKIRKAGKEGKTEGRNQEIDAQMKQERTWEGEKTQERSVY
jgi:hypothetical protein